MCPRTGEHQRGLRGDRAPVPHGAHRQERLHHQADPRRLRRRHHLVPAGDARLGQPHRAQGHGRGHRQGEGRAAQARRPARRARLLGGDLGEARVPQVPRRPQGHQRQHAARQVQRAHSLPRSHGHGARHQRRPQRHQRGHHHHHR